MTTTTTAQPRRLRYVEIPADRLHGELAGIAAKVQGAGGNAGWSLAGSERVFWFQPRDCPVCVKLYTTLDGGKVARGCGEDAMRIVLVDADTERGLGKLFKILRTAPQGVEDRVGRFLDRLRDKLREAWAAARNVPACRNCGKAMALRKRKRDGAPFYGCTGYPDCKTIQEVTRG